MTLKWLILIMIVSTQTLLAQKVEIITSDIPHFWEAVDSLAYSKDSVKTIQRLYLDKASAGLKSFNKGKNFSAEQYVESLKAFPKFWKSIRPRTQQILEQREKIEKVMKKYKDEFPEFKTPAICFAISPLRSGGTTGKKMILIGAEIACADTLTDISELRWMKSIFAGRGTIEDFISHEAVHTVQRFTFALGWQFLTRRLLAFSVVEGAADFVSKKISNSEINKAVYGYGNQHFDQLKKEFLEEMNKSSYSKWLYGVPKGRPKDLGYFMGYKICEGYYENSKDKKKALDYLSKTKNPKKILRMSGFTNVRTGL